MHARLQVSGFETLDKDALSKDEKAALSKDEIPSLYPAFPQGTKVGTQEAPDAAMLELIEKARFFADFSRYSGYYQPSKQGSTVLHVERYSDRFRRVEGRRTLADEIGEPSPSLFPQELISGLGAQSAKRRKGAHLGFQSATALAKSREVLSGGDERAATQALTQPQGPEPEVEPEEEEEESQEEEEEAAEEELSEVDDYGEMYGDDDEGGGDVFGDDNEEIL